MRMQGPGVAHRDTREEPGDDGGRGWRGGANSLEGWREQPESRRGAVTLLGP